MSNKKPIKVEPGSELHFVLLGAPMGLNFLTGKDRADLHAFARSVWDAATQAARAQAAPAVDLFFVRHYNAEDRPTIKGNGFDGLEIGETREEAEAFVAWVNARIAPQPAQEGGSLEKP